MPKKNQIKFRDFERAVKKYIRQNFYDCKIIPKSGSGIRFELFNKDNKVPVKMWVIHKSEFIHKGDLQKTCDNIGIEVDEFINLL